MKKLIGILKYLPTELAYLIEPAMKYGIHQFPDARFEFLQNASKEDLEALAVIAERIRTNDHGDLVSEFLDQYPITAHPESSNLYFLFGVMDDARLNFVNDNWNTVEKLIASIEKHGSRRRASNRMHAAKFLANFGENAKPAIPALTKALDDPDIRVKVWAHFALAVLQGDRARHEAAVREIFSQHNTTDSLGCYDDVGGEARDALQRFQELS